MSVQDITRVSDFDQKYTWAYQSESGYLSRAEENLRMYLGDQWQIAEKQKLMQEGRAVYVVNTIRPNIDMVVGYQQKNRLSSVAVPVGNEDQLVSDQISKLLLYFMNAGDVFETISDAYRGALVTGLNMLCTYVDYSNDPMGELSVAREAYNGFILDPFFMKRDLSDCGYLLRRKFVDLATAKELLPKEKRFLTDQIKKGGYRDEKFTWLPYAAIGNTQPMIAIDEHWEKKTKVEKVLIDSQTGIEYPYDGNDYLMFVSPTIQLVEKSVPYIERHVFVNHSYIFSETNPYGLNEYPFVPVFCYWNPEAIDWSLKCSSMVDSMFDAQRESNKRRSQMTDIIESQLVTGWIAEDGSVVNPRALFSTGQGSVIWKKRGMDPQSITRIDPPQIPPSFFEMKNTSDSDIQRVAGISDELLGQQDSQNDSGLKVALRQGAALVGLQPLQDGLRLSQKILSRKLVKLLPAIGQAKLARILGEAPDPKLQDQHNLKFDIQIQEGLLTQTQQQQFFAQLIALKEIGEPIPPGLIARAAPMQGKSEYYRAMEEFNAQQQQAQQQQQQIQNALLDSEQKLANSQSISNMALANERMAQASKFNMEQEKIKEQAVDSKADATLKRMETIQKLQEFDDRRLDRLIATIERLESLTRIDSAQVEQQQHVNQQETQV